MTAQAVAALNFEQALSQLEKIVEELEAGRVGLEDSINIYDRGRLLREHCEKLLRDAEIRIEKITLKPDGSIAGTGPLDPE